MEWEGHEGDEEGIGWRRMHSDAGSFVRFFERGVFRWAFLFEHASEYVLCR